MLREFTSPCAQAFRYKLEKIRHQKKRGKKKVLSFLLLNSVMRTAPPASVSVFIRIYPAIRPALLMNHSYHNFNSNSRAKTEHCFPTLEHKHALFLEVDETLRWHALGFVTNRYALTWAAHDEDKERQEPRSHWDFVLRVRLLRKKQFVCKWNCRRLSQPLKYISFFLPY